MGPGHQKTLCRTQALAWGTHRVRFSCEVSGEDGSGGTGPGRGCLSSSAPRDAAGQSSGNRSSLRGAGLAVTPSGQAEPCVLALVSRPYTQNMIDIDIAHRRKHAGLRWKPTNGNVVTIDNEQLRDDAFMLSSMVIEPMIARNGNRLFRFNGTTEWALDSVEQHEALWIPREDQLREALGEAFLALHRDADVFVVSVGTGADGPREVRAPRVEDAYAGALLIHLTRGSALLVQGTQSCHPLLRHSLVTPLPCRPLPSAPLRCRAPAPRPSADCRRSAHALRPGYRKGRPSRWGRPALLASRARSHGPPDH